MKLHKNTPRRFYDADPIPRRSTGSPARSPRRDSLKARFCSAATRLANPLVDLLLDILVWFFRIRDDAPGDLVFNSPIPTLVPQRDIPAGGGHA